MSEIFAGIARAITSDRFDDATRDAMWGLLVPAAELAISNVSYEFSADWADALRFCAAKRHPSRLEPLVTMILDKVVSCFADAPSNGLNGSDAMEVVEETSGSAVVEAKTLGARDDYSHQSKWLRMFQALAIEFAGHIPAHPTLLALRERVMDVRVFGGVGETALGHPYKLCREMLGKTLFLLLDFGPDNQVGSARSRSKPGTNGLRPSLPRSLSGRSLTHPSTLPPEPMHPKPSSPRASRVRSAVRSASASESG